MKKTIIVAAIAAASIVSAGMLMAQESAAEFFMRDRENNWTGALRYERAAPKFTLQVPRRVGRSNDLPKILAVTRKMGIPDRLAARICRVESRCLVNGPAGPKTKHGRHYGAYQTRPNVAARFGYNRAKHGPLVGQTALYFGARHLQDCWRRARGNEALAARCHVAGPGSIGRQLRPAAERYARTYTRQVRVAWAGDLR